MGNESDAVKLDTVRIGKYIAEKRRGLGLTQQGLADRLNVTNKAVSKWETGQGAPDIGTLPRLAAVLQVTADEILKGEGRGKNAENVPPDSAGPLPDEGGSGQPAFTVATRLSRDFRLTCNKVIWQNFRIGLRLTCLIAGIALAALAAAGAGVSQLTSRSVPPAMIAVCALGGACFLVLTAEGYRFSRSIRETGAEETCTCRFFGDHVSITKADAEKSWRYAHVTQILESKECFLIRCGEETEFLKKSALPAEQPDAFRAFLREHCSGYKDVSKGRWARVLGFGLAVAALLILLFQSAYLFLHARYGVVYQTGVVEYLINFAGLVCIFLSSVFFARRCPVIWAWVGIACGALIVADITVSVMASVKTQDILSSSPDGRNVLILKRDTSTNQVKQYRHPFLFFARPYRQFPYEAFGTIKTQWLAGDICAVTYISEQNGPAHQIVAAFGDRGRTDNYYVEAALDGSWEPSGQNTAGWRLVRDTKGIVLSNGSTEYNYDAKDCVQYGLTAIVLCKGGLPEWTVALNKDCKIDPKTLLVSYGGTLTLCKVSMSPTPPLVLRSTSKSSVDNSNVLIESASKDTYRIQNGVLSLSWDYGHRWTAVSLPENALSSMLQSDSTDKLADGCYHIADDFTYLLYGQTKLSVLFIQNEGKNQETHPVANLAGDGITSRYVVYTSGQTADVAVGLSGTADMKGSMLFTTKDGGRTWQSKATPSTQTLTGMNFLSQDVGYLSYTDASGASGELYETTDGGRSFTKAALPAGNLAEVDIPASGLTFGQVYDTPQVPQLEHGIPVLYVTQGSDGDFGYYRARYESKDGGRTWRYVSQEKPSASSGS